MNKPNWLQAIEELLRLKNERPHKDEDGYLDWVKWEARYEMELATAISNDPEAEPVLRDWAMSFLMDSQQQYLDDGLPAAIRALIETARNDDDQTKREQAVRALISHGIATPEEIATAPVEHIIHNMSHRSFDA
jgi:hypothetical protein